MFAVNLSYTPQCFISIAFSQPSCPSVRLSVVFLRSLHYVDTVAAQVRVQHTVHWSLDSSAAHTRR